MAKELETTAEVMTALGGSAVVAKLTRRKLNTASNWQSFDTFPPDTFVVMTEALAAKGFTAPQSLWRMVEGAPLSPDPTPQEAVVS